MRGVSRHDSDRWRDEIIWQGKPAGTVAGGLTAYLLSYGEALAYLCGALVLACAAWMACSETLRYADIRYDRIELWASDLEHPLFFPKVGKSALDANLTIKETRVKISMRTRL